jgi:hypothetical protein
VTTIDPQHAQELYWQLHDGNGELSDGSITEGPWTLIGSSLDDVGRWHTRYWLIVRDEAGDTWGLVYGIGLTEHQEDDLPWERRSRSGPLELTRLYPREVTRVEYGTKPARPETDTDTRAAHVGPVPADVLEAVDVAALNLALGDEPPADRTDKAWLDNLAAGADLARLAAESGDTGALASELLELAARARL